MTSLKKSLNWRLAAAMLTLMLVVGGANLSLRYDSEECIKDCVNKMLEAEQVSWLSWLTGRSTSYRFHFLDLLELLSRRKGQDSE